MIRGIDWSKAKLPIEDMPRWGYRVAFRYLCWQNPTTLAKILTAIERDRILKVLDLIPNWEWYAARAKEGYTSGLVDGREAHRQLVNLHYPGGRYVAVSDDSFTDASNWARVSEYLRGFIVGCPGYQVVPYGNRYCIDAAFDRFGCRGWQNNENHRHGVGVSSHAFAWQTGNQSYGGEADDNILYAPYLSWKVGPASQVPSHNPPIELGVSDTDMNGFLHKQNEVVSGKPATVYYLVAPDLSSKQIISDPGTLQGLIATKQYLMHPAGGEYLSQAQVARIPLAAGSRPLGG